MDDENDPSVIVYHFEVWNGINDRMIIPPRKSPEERIKSIGGNVLWDSAEEVPVSALDDEGRFDPRNRDTTNA
jgi:hypothetical protein